MGLFISISWRVYGRPARHVRRVLATGRQPCVWCGYALDDAGWPRQCPECGSIMTREEVVGRWRRLGLVKNDATPRGWIKARFKRRTEIRVSK